jgi:hypothetical protein
MDEFKRNALKYILDTCKYHIKYGFDLNDRCNRHIMVQCKNYEIKIQRNCFYPDNNYYSYFEDYSVEFKGNFNHKKISSSFYLEWNENEVDSELIPANTKFNPATGVFSNRTIKIKYTDEIVNNNDNSPSLNDCV